MAASTPGGGNTASGEEASNASQSGSNEGGPELKDDGVLDVDGAADVDDGNA